MLQSGNKRHLNAMNEMQELMQSPNAMVEWFDNKRKHFDDLPENN